MMRKIRCAAGEIVRVEKGKGIDQDRGNGDRYQEGNYRMARCFASISREEVSEWVLRVEDRGFGSSVAGLSMMDEHTVYMSSRHTFGRQTYPRRK